MLTIIKWPTLFFTWDNFQIYGVFLHVAIFDSWTVSPMLLNEPVLNFTDSFFEFV